MSRGPAAPDRPAEEGKAPRPRVVIDARIVGPSPNGIARYTVLVARGLSMLAASRPEGLPYEPVFLVRRDLSPDLRGEFHGFALREVAAPFLHPREQWELPVALRGLRGRGVPVNACIYHSPSFSALASCPVPWIVTIHDLIHLSHGTPLQGLYYRALVRRFVRGAAARLTVSDASRRELAGWSGLPPATIETVPTAIDPDFEARPTPEEIERALAPLALEPRRYLLCISNPKRHKNVDMLVHAYRRYRDSEPGASLPLVLNFPDHSGAAGVRVIPALGQRELRCVMAGCAGFLFPSLVEGFGLPPLEAAVLGVPLALSDIPAHREALSPFAPEETMWLDPVDEEGWVGAMRLASTGGLPRAGAEGRARALDRFSVARLGAALDRVYRRVLEA